MIYEILKQKGARGPENAITRDELATITGLEIRKLRHQVQKERKRHIICGVVGGKGGYYRPASRQEIRAYRDLFEKRIAEFAITLRLPRRIIRHSKP